jgi:hypothetical protein
MSRPEVPRDAHHARGGTRGVSRRATRAVLGVDDPGRGPLIIPVWYSCAPRVGSRSASSPSPCPTATSAWKGRSRHWTRPSPRRSAAPWPTATSAQGGDLYVANGGAGRRQRRLPRGTGALAHDGLRQARLTSVHAAPFTVVGVLCRLLSNGPTARPTAPTQLRRGVGWPRLSGGRPALTQPGDGHRPQPPARSCRLIPGPASALSKTRAAGRLTVARRGRARPRRCRPGPG